MNETQLYDGRNKIFTCARNAYRIILAETQGFSLLLLYSTIKFNTASVKTVKNFMKQMRQKCTCPYCQKKICHLHKITSLFTFDLWRHPFSPRMNIIMRKQILKLTPGKFPNFQEWPRKFSQFHIFAVKWWVKIIWKCMKVRHEWGPSQARMST